MKWLIRTFFCVKNVVGEVVGKNSESWRYLTPSIGMQKMGPRCQVTNAQKAKLIASLESEKNPNKQM